MYAKERGICEDLRGAGIWRRAVPPQYPREGELWGQTEAAVRRGKREFLETQEAQNELSGG